MIYPVDSAIHRLNNWGQIKKKVKLHLKVNGGGGGGGKDLKDVLRYSPLLRRQSQVLG